MPWRVCHRSPALPVSEVDATGEVRVPADSEWEFERTERGPHKTGPAREVTARPFYIVYGSTAGDEATERLRRGAESPISGARCCWAHVRPCRCRH